MEGVCGERDIGEEWEGGLERVVVWEAFTVGVVTGVGGCAGEGVNLNWAGTLAGGAFAFKVLCGIVSGLLVIVVVVVLAAFYMRTCYS